MSTADMASFDWASFASGLALVISVTSPIITVLMNNHHQDKVREQDFYEKHKAEVIEGYLRCVSNALNSPSAEAINEYSKYYGEIFLYAPEDIHDNLKTINTGVKKSILSFYDDKSRQNDLNVFYEVASSLSKEYPRNKK